MRLPALAGSLLFAAAAASAQVAAPETWRKESFTFPLSFAPTIPYEGVEHVRFSPTWTDFAGERGFTYVFVWDLKRREIEPRELEQRLNAYFDGIMESVTKVRKLADPGTVTSTALHPIKAIDGWPLALGGRVHTWNGFAKGEALTLHLEATLRHCGVERTQVFFAFSKAAREHAVWDDLRAIRRDTPC